MANPTVPHIIGVTLDSTGVAYTSVIVKNRTTGDSVILDTNSSKQAIFDCASFTNGYSNSDVIEVVNSGASFGGNTVTIDTSEGMQTTTLTCTALASGANLSM